MRRFASTAATGVGAFGRGGLWVVGVPIGNLADMPRRGLGALATADVILCEDTRRTAQLLQLLGVESYMPRLHRFDAHSRDSARWINQIKLGRSVCLVSDAGTPAISDPGALLVHEVGKLGLPISPVPGPSAITALLSVCGFHSGGGGAHFTFRGFFPRKPQEQAAECKLIMAPHGLQVSRTFVYFESPLRIASTLANITSSVKENTTKAAATLVVAKELTKLHERVFRGETCDEVLAQVLADLKLHGDVGEWCFAVHLPPSSSSHQQEEDGANALEPWCTTLQCLLRANVSVAESTRQVCTAYPTVNKKLAYKEALRIKSSV